MNIRKAVVFPEPTFCIAAWREVMARYYRQDGFEGHDDQPILLGPDDRPFDVTTAWEYGERLAAELL